MYKLDAFGQRVPMRPLRLRFLTDEEQKAADQKAADEKAAAEKAAAEKKAAEGNLGFPVDTALEQMTGDQREAYWKHQARKHENTVKARQDYDDLKKKADKLDEIESANATEQEKAVNAAREEARREGETIGAERYLKDAVKANFRVATGLSIEDVDQAFEHVDATSFIGTDGNIDQTALDKFAGTFGTKAAGGSSNDPVREHLERQRLGGGAGGGTGSVSDIRAQRVERLTGGKK